jgi:hypothetical protein
LDSHGHKCILLRRDVADGEIIVDELDKAGLIWRKSSHSADGACVEVACVKGHQVLVRDSKDRSGPVLQFSVPEWRAFLGGVHDGEFDFL